MLAKKCFLLLVLSVYSYGNLTETPQDSEKYFWSPGQIWSGIKGIGSSVTGRVSSTGSLIKGKIENTTNQVGKLATDIKQQAVEVVKSGKQLTEDVVAMVTKQTLTGATFILIRKFNFISYITGWDYGKLEAINTTLTGVGDFQTSEGKLYRLSTMRLDGALNVSAEFLAIRLAIPLAFEELGVSFERYDFSTWGIGINGSLDAKIGENGFIAHVVIQLGILCQVNVEKVEVSRLSKIDLKMTGLCGWCSSVVTYITNFLQQMIHTKVQEAIDKGLRKVLTEESFIFCSLPGIVQVR